VSVSLSRVPGLDLGGAVMIPAPESGVLLGQRRGKVVTVRIFRPQGSRIVVLGDIRAPQLLAVRAAMMGARLEIATGQRHVWQRVAASTPDSIIGAHGAILPSIGTPFRPIVVVDDRSQETVAGGDAAPWQCRIDLRAVPAPDAVAQYGGADLLLLGPLPVGVASSVVELFHLEPAMDSALASMPADGIAAVRRGGVQLMSTAETPAETALLGARTAVAIAVPQRTSSVVTGSADPRTVPPWAVRELAALREAALTGRPQPVTPPPFAAPTGESFEPLQAPAATSLPEPVVVVQAGSAVIGVDDEDLDGRTVPRWAVEQLREQVRGDSGGGPNEAVDPHH
jgi:hypothetical protein